MPTFRFRALALAALGAILPLLFALAQQPVVVRAARMLDVAKGQIVKIGRAHV